MLFYSDIEPLSICVVIILTTPIVPDRVLAAGYVQSGVGLCVGLRLTAKVV
ncbi:MAG: hypothetical protein ACLUW6_09010 [Coriobacteriaceae bacterium]